GADGDPDGDGFTNLQELFAGTDPTDAGSSPMRISAIAKETDDVRVTWTTGNRKTILESSPGDASGGFTTNNFTSIFSVSNKTDSVTNYLDIGAATNVPAF